MQDFRRINITHWLRNIWRMAVPAALSPLNWPVAVMQQSVLWTVWSLPPSQLMLLLPSLWSFTQPYPPSDERRAAGWSRSFSRNDPSFHWYRKCRWYYQRSGSGTEKCINNQFKKEGYICSCMMHPSFLWYIFSCSQLWHFRKLPASCSERLSSGT